MLRFLSGGQIIFFLIAITVICVQIFRLPYNRQIEGSSEIRIEINGKKVEYNILPNTKIKLIIDENGKIELQNI
jgi:hypothetical protein